MDKVQLRAASKTSRLRVTTAIIGSSGSIRIPCWTETSAAKRLISVVSMRAGLKRQFFELFKQVPLDESESLFCHDWQLALSNRFLKSQFGGNHFFQITSERVL